MNLIGCGRVGVLALVLSGCIWGHDCRSCKDITYKGHLHDYPYTYQGAMDTLKSSTVAYTVSTLYPGENPEAIVGSRITYPCGCEPSSVQILLEGGLRYGEREYANQDIYVDSVRKNIVEKIIWSGELLFKDSVVFKAGTNRFLLEAVTPDGRTVRDTFAFFVPDTLGYTD
jgi:hypothetical protein